MIKGFKIDLLMRSRSRLESAVRSNYEVRNGDPK
jgi:hypothetical protein